MAVKVDSQKVSLIEKFIGEIEQPDMKAVLYLFSPDLKHGNYLLASLINDMVSIIRMQIMEKPVRFYTNVDGTIPNSLIGDGLLLRQVLISLLSNAVKYTDKGRISLTITQEKRDGKRIWLKIVAADTGYGIKPEDQANLFGDLVQIDTKRSRGIECTGLDLAVTKKLCLAMGGDITVESVYGKGTSFTVTIPQEVGSDDLFAAVDEPEKKKILVYERRAVYADSVSWSLENMKVPHVMVSDLNAFEEALFREEWYYVFSGYNLYEKIKLLMERPAAGFANGKKPALALMVEWGVETHIPNVRFVSLPVQSLSIANVLNSGTDDKDISESPDEGTIRFSLPSARVLVVDDIDINLMLAEGILEPYKATVDTCLSGARAIEMVRQNDYDLVFMDHMMPEMDGMEATAAIRKWEAEQGKLKVPIIALTANAVSGVREMFVEKGFSDFLAKPIDISQMDEILGRWIKKEKIEIITEINKKLIILVDDDPVNLRAGKSILSEKYIVATAPSAEKLFTLLQNNTPALILLDVDMPVMTGYDTIKKLKSRPETREIPVILLNEHSDSLSGERGQALRASLGAADNFSKPFDSAGLFTCIERHI